MTDGDVRGVVTDQVARLQRALLSPKPAPARASLAHLRQGVGKPAGSVPAIWDLTLQGLRVSETGDDPTPAETAAHVAMTLYAVHQQSKTSGMHKPGVGLGSAVSRLAGRPGAPGHDAVRRRFDAVATASSVEEVAHHLRGLVGQLRAAGIPLDYGRLADDLRRLQLPGGFDAVRRQWGRDLTRRRPDDLPDVEAGGDPDGDAPSES